MIAMIPALLPMLPGIIQGVENLFGSKRGKKKKEAAVAMASGVVRVVRDSGLLEKDGSNVADVVIAVETMLAQMRKDGRLLEAGKAVPAPTEAGCPLQGLLAGR